MSGIGAGGPSGKKGDKETGPSKGNQRRQAQREAKADKAKQDQKKADAAAAELLKTQKEEEAKAKAAKQEQEDIESGAAERMLGKLDKKVIGDERKLAAKTGPVLPIPGHQRRQAAVQSTGVPKLELGSTNPKRTPRGPNDTPRGHGKAAKESGTTSKTTSKEIKDDSAGRDTSEARARPGASIPDSRLDDGSLSTASKGKGKQIERRETSVGSDRALSTVAINRRSTADFVPSSESDSKTPRARSEVKGKGKETEHGDGYTDAWLANLGESGLTDLCEHSTRLNAMFTTFVELRRLETASTHKRLKQEEESYGMVRHELQKKHSKLEEQATAKKEVEAKQKEAAAKAEWDYELNKVKEAAEVEFQLEVSSAKEFVSVDSINGEIDRKADKVKSTERKLAAAEDNLDRAERARGKARVAIACSTQSSDDEIDQEDKDPSHVRIRDPSPEKFVEERQARANWVAAKLRVAEAKSEWLAAEKVYCHHMLYEALKADHIVRFSERMLLGASARGVSEKDKQDTGVVIKAWNENNILKWHEEEFTSFRYRIDEAKAALASARAEVLAWNAQNKGYAIKLQPRDTAKAKGRTDMLEQRP